MLPALLARASLVDANPVSRGPLLTVRIQPIFRVARDSTGRPSDTSRMRTSGPALRSAHHGKLSRVTAIEQRNFDSIIHIVHDWSMLVRAGEMTGQPSASPVNHFIQHAFLVECRKFANFFKNNPGPLREDMVATEFVIRRLKAPLPVWGQWHRHMNRQLMHLSYRRIENKTPWDGSANAPLLKELTDTWEQFLTCLSPLYEAEFLGQLRSRGM